MTHFPLQTLETADDRARPALEGLQTAFGNLPNIIRIMANAPVLLNSLAALFQNVHSGSFSEPQIQVLLLTNAVTNAAEWPVAFHSYLALAQGIEATDVDAIRSGRLPADPKLAALSHLAKHYIETRGHLDPSHIDIFLAAGFSQEHLLEVIAVVAASTITNYTASVTAPLLEAPFDAHVWRQV
ncbi:carboxymuconolactone decarboxylase family protein [Asticcacaulis taihuensis]|uniref:carboxymuconolactone decarboxylase family protein n=1 Tax=Asticcacaulis taihuensis TaxID=260084 RepID=UPI0026EE7896|nr:hypothetical protein [Asticcacaulis taihuensis]